MGMFDGLKEAVMPYVTPHPRKKSADEVGDTAANYARSPQPNFLKRLLSSDHFREKIIGAAAVAMLAFSMIMLMSGVGAASVLGITAIVGIVASVLVFVGVLAKLGVLKAAKDTVIESPKPLPTYAKPDAGMNAALAVQHSQIVEDDLRQSLAALEDREAADENVNDADELERLASTAAVQSPQLPRRAVQQHVPQPTAPASISLEILAQLRTKSERRAAEAQPVADASKDGASSGSAPVQESAPSSVNQQPKR